MHVLSFRFWGTDGREANIRLKLYAGCVALLQLTTRVEQQPPANENRMLNRSCVGLDKLGS